MLDYKRFLTAVLLGLLIFTGCKKPEPEGYRVVGYDAATHQWTIMRNGNFNGTYLRKRLTVVCELSQWGNQEALLGKDVCHLQVGELIIPTMKGKRIKDQAPVRVYEMPDQVLSISQGDGDNQRRQLFKIITYEVLPDEK